MSEHPTQKRSLEDLAAVQGEQGELLVRIASTLEQHGEILTRIIGRLDGQTTVITQHTHLLNEHSRLLKAILERLPEQPS